MIEGDQLSVSIRNAMKAASVLREQHGAELADQLDIALANGIDDLVAGLIHVAQQVMGQRIEASMIEATVRIELIAERKR